jgi:hypothetical protein
MLTLAGTDTLSDCPGCGGRDFARASLFSAGGLARGRISGPTMPGGSGTPGPIFAGRALANPGGAADVRRAGGRITGARTLGREAGGGGGALSQPEPVDSDAWLEDARELLGEPGEYLAYEDAGECRTVALTREWTRIGRSLAADVRFDDPTVSRRHALVVRQADGVRVLDDRSLNGVFVNGSRIEWKVLKDGDEIVVGRYRLRFLSIPAEPDDAPTSTPSTARTLHSPG